MLCFLRVAHEALKCSFGGKPFLARQAPNSFLNASVIRDIFEHAMAVNQRQLKIVEQYIDAKLEHEKLRTCCNMDSFSILTSWPVLYEENTAPQAY